MHQFYAIEFGHSTFATVFYDRFKQTRQTCSNRVTVEMQSFNDWVDFFAFVDDLARRVVVATTLVDLVDVVCLENWSAIDGWRLISVFNDWR